MDLHLHWAKETYADTRIWPGELLQRHELEKLIYDRNGNETFEFVWVNEQTNGNYLENFFQNAKLSRTTTKNEHVCIDSGKTLFLDHQPTSRSNLGCWKLARYLSKIIKIGMIFEKMTYELNFISYLFTVRDVTDLPVSTHFSKKSSS